MFPESRFEWSLSLDNLARPYTLQQSGHRDDLDEAILFNDRLTLRPVYYPELWVFLYSLAIALFTRLEESGQYEDLVEAILFY